MQHRERTEATCRAEALALLQSKLSEIVVAKVTGISLDEVKPVPFSEFLKGFMERGEKTYRPSTYKSLGYMKQTLEEHFGARPLRSISRKDVKEFYRSLGKNKAATGNRYLSFVSAVFREAVDRDLVESNPARGIKKDREDNFKLRYLSEHEEVRLERFLPVWLRPIVSCALHTGMRRGEIVRLTWADVDFNANRIMVRIAKNHRERGVPMNPTLRGMLEGMRPPAETWQESPYVFADAKGEPWGDTSVSHAFQQAVEAAGIEGASFHTLRHTCASRMVQRGVPLKAVQEILGHSSMNVTLRYAHLAKGDLDAAVAVLDNSGTPAVQAVSKNRRSRKSLAANRPRSSTG